MKNSFATMVACVWCGLALLRSTGVKLRPKRGTVVVCVLKYPSRSRLGGSIPPLRTIHLQENSQRLFLASAVNVMRDRVSTAISAGIGSWVATRTYSGRLMA